MGAIIQTLTLAAILLIIGLACLVIGVAGLMWSIRRDKRQIEKNIKAEISSEIADSAFPEPATRETSLKS
jgi:uncharacterized membrane protein YciS (DUF1049 family)